MLDRTVNKLTFYCPQHQLRFRATGEAVVTCEQDGHAIGFGFPDKSWWQYCCDCATYWPSEPSNGFLHRSDCVVCERPTAKRYVCSRCQVISIESSVPVRRKLFSITSEEGISPNCPGCARPPDHSPIEHKCREIGISILTSRAECPFCETAVQSRKAEKVHAETTSVCPFCGTVGKPDITFCGKCGKPQPRTSIAVERTSSAAAAIKNKAGSESVSDSDGITTERADLRKTSSFETQAAGSGIHNGESDAIESPSDAPWQTALPESPPKRRVRLWPVAIVVVVTVVIGLGFAIVFGPRRGKPAPANVSPSPPPGMLYIPGGQFAMGNDLGDEYEKPAHKVTVNKFFIDQNEVTCGDYEKFVKATNHRPPPGWSNGSCPAGTANNPVTGVDWYDAMAYAQSAGKRLPTEEEWEFAARGSDGRLYPWGNEWRPNAANAGDSSAGHFTNVGSYPEGKSPYGSVDMIGNAWEWTASNLTAYPGGRLSDQSPGELKVIRGGYFGSSAPKATTTFRRGWDARDAPLGYKNTGFRCAKDL